MSDEDERSSLPAGAVIGGRFRVERLLGRGGMGEVYAARHTTTGKEVALKLIHAATGSGKERTRRFMREARAATAIQHPNVIEIFDVFEDADGTPVMVMELLKGEPFSGWLRRAGALRLFETAEALLPAVRALEVAHSKGIVHRDLKPDNVFLAQTPAGRVTKVLDFGIAKVLDPTQISSQTQGQQTNTGSILGTPHYMSFEQAMSDKTVDHRTDIWAMGVMIFEALTGRRPLTYDTLGQMYATFLQGSVPSIRQYLPNVPDDFAQVLDRCLAKQRDERLSSLAPLAEVLARYVDPRVPGAGIGGRVVDAPVASAQGATFDPIATGMRPSRPVKSGRPLWLALVAVAALGVGGGALFLVRRGTTADSHTAAMALPSSTMPGALGSASAAAAAAPGAPSAAGATGPTVSSPAPPPEAVASGGSASPVGAGSSLQRGPRAHLIPGAAPAPAPAPAPGPAPTPARPTPRGISDKVPY